MRHFNCILLLYLFNFPGIVQAGITGTQDKTVFMLNVVSRCVASLMVTWPGTWQYKQRQECQLLLLTMGLWISREVNELFN